MATAPSKSSIIGGLNIGKASGELAPMERGTASGWGQTYHWVACAQSEHVSRQEQTSAGLEWCRTTMGRPGSRWFEKADRFYFRSEQDLSMFVLRWI